MIRRFSSLVVLILITGCGWIQDYRVRSKAMDEVHKEFRLMLSKEFHDALGAGFARENDYIEFVLGETTIEIADIPERKGETIPVTAKIHTVSHQARHDLLEIIRPLRDTKLNAFNFNDALVLIHQRGIPTSEDQEKRMTLSL